MTSSSVIPPAPNVMEDETRRNTFWIGERSPCTSWRTVHLTQHAAYMMERHFGALNNFAMMLDDEDISQMLPVHGDQFEQGVCALSKSHDFPRTHRSLDFSSPKSAAVVARSGRHRNALGTADRLFHFAR